MKKSKIINGPKISTEIIENWIDQHRYGWEHNSHDKI